MSIFSFIYLILGFLLVGLFVGAYVYEKLF